MNIQLFGAKKLHGVRDIILKNISSFFWIDDFSRLFWQNRYPKQKSSFLDNIFLIG